MGTSQVLCGASVCAQRSRAPYKGTIGKDRGAYHRALCIFLGMGDVVFAGLGRAGVRSWH